MEEEKTTKVQLRKAQINMMVNLGYMERVEIDPLEFIECESCNMRVQPSDDIKVYFTTCLHRTPLFTYCEKCLVKDVNQW